MQAISLSFLASPSFGLIASLIFLLTFYFAVLCYCYVCLCLVVLGFYAHVLFCLYNFNISASS